ncbi:MAG: DUF58 domain-containing protein [Chthoniobacter sp.]|nr:DUF58 domain-containing protein [Chthoniobacter sp.]
MSAPERSPRVWVLPNRNAVGLGAVLLGMWYAGASQANGAAYLLGFVLAGVAAVSAVHAWSNLRGVACAAEPIAPVFAGGELVVSLMAKSTRNRAHWSVVVRAPGGRMAARFGEITATGEERAQLAIPARERGCFSTLGLRVESIFPLGFFTARQVLRLAQPHYIYPAPVGGRPLPRTLAPTREARGGPRGEGEDFGGLRAWQSGESQRHIDWKSAARGQPLLVKQWTGEVDEILSLDWSALDGIETEARLSQLAAWIVQAEQGGDRYSLRLPGRNIAPARGEGHYHACLRALAAHVGGEEMAAP